MNDKIKEYILSKLMPIDLSFGLNKECSTRDIHIICDYPKDLKREVLDAQHSWVSNNHLRGAGVWFSLAENQIVKTCPSYGITIILCTECFSFIKTSILNTEVATFIELLENKTIDIHSYTASLIIRLIFSGHMSNTSDKFFMTIINQLTGDKGIINLII